MPLFAPIPFRQSAAAGSRASLRDRFGATEVEVQNFLALEAGMSIGLFRDTLEDWLEDVDKFYLRT